MFDACFNRTGLWSIVCSIKARSSNQNQSVMGWQWGQGPWMHFPYVQVSDVLCYRPIPIIYRTSLLQNFLKVIMETTVYHTNIRRKYKVSSTNLWICKQAAYLIIVKSQCIGQQWPRYQYNTIQYNNNSKTKKPLLEDRPKLFKGCSAKE